LFGNSVAPFLSLSLFILFHFILFYMCVTEKEEGLFF
jgi:hypothetical protein